MKRTLLAVHPGSIGDVLVARQALAALRFTYADHALGLIVRHDVGALLEACGEAHQTFPLEGTSLAGLLAGHDSTPPALREWLRRCELAVCWMSDPGSLGATLQAFGVGQTVFESASTRVVEIHQADYLLRTVRAHVRAGSTAESLRLPEPIRGQGLELLQSLGISGTCFVIIHPGSGSLDKCVAPEVLASVADGLGERGIPVVLAEGPADEVQVWRVRALCRKVPPAVSGEELAVMAGVLSHAALFIGNDSGLTHLAAALAVPTIALFGPTDQSRWIPRGAKVTVMSGPPCLCEGWAKVRSCLDKPCLRIDPERILAVCDECLSASIDVECAAHSL